MNTHSGSRSTRYGLFVWGFTSYSRIFHPYKDATITGTGLQILTFAWHFRPVCNAGSFACYTDCDTGHPFIRSSPGTRDTPIYCQAFCSGAVTTCFYDLGLPRLGFDYTIIPIVLQRAKETCGYKSFGYFKLLNMIPKKKHEYSILLFLLFENFYFYENLCEF